MRNFFKTLIKKLGKKKKKGSSMKWKFLNTIDMLGEKNCLKRKSFSLLRFPFSKKKSKEKGIGGNGKSFKGENKRKKKRPIFRFH